MFVVVFVVGDECLMFPHFSDLLTYFKSQYPVQVLSRL